MHTSTATAFVNNMLRYVVVAAVGRSTNHCDDCLVQQRISRLIALVVLGTKYLAATPL